MGSRRIDWWTALLALPFVAVTVHLAIVGSQLVDDAFISFRYSANLADGHGLVYDAGERVEGFTNLLWTVLLAAPALVGLSLPWTSLALGVACLLATVALAIAAVHAAGAPRWAVVGAGTLVAASPQLVGSSVNGLETALYAAGLAACAYGLAAGNPVALAGGIFGAGTARTEGFFVALLAAALAVYAGRALWRPAAAGVVAVLAVKAAEVAYFGDLLPMSVQAKRDNDVGVLESVSRSWDAGSAYVTSQLGWRWLAVAALALAVGVAARPALVRRPLMLWCVCAFLFGLVVAVSNKGDWMPYARLLAPYLPLAFVAVAVSVGELPDALAPSAAATRIALVALVAVALAPVWPDNPDNKVGHSHDEVGRAIERAQREGDVLASGVIGRIGYYGRPIEVADLYGLVEPDVARQKVAATVLGKDGTPYVAAQRPAVIVHNRWAHVLGIARAAGRPYHALVSPGLTTVDAYVAVRSDRLGDYAQAFAEPFGARAVPLDEGERVWRATVPAGSTEEQLAAG